MENLLNDLFDPINRGITIETSFDLLEPIYVPQPGSEFGVSPIYVGQPSETPLLFVGQPVEYGIVHDFIVTVPEGILTPNQEVQLKHVVYKYKLLSKKPQFIYDNSTIF